MDTEKERTDEVVEETGVPATRSADRQARG
jgi:hypothetical protein